MDVFQSEVGAGPLTNAQVNLIENSLYVLKFRQGGVHIFVDSSYPKFSFFKLNFFSSLKKNLKGVVTLNDEPVIDVK